MSSTATESRLGVRLTQSSATWAVLLLPVMALWVATVALRWGDWDLSYPSQEATWHSLLTIDALRTNPLSDHLALPTISLPGASNHSIPWGATVPTATGAFIYTSFSPLGWLIPAALLGISDTASSVEALFVFGSLLGLVSALALTWLAWTWNVTARGIWAAFGTGSAVGMAYLFAPEVLLSQGVLFWPHALAQVFWIACLGAFLLFMRRPNRWGWPLVGLAASVFLYCLTEWSGYVAAFGLTAILVFLAWRSRARKFGYGALAVLSASLLAGALTLLHFSLGIGLQATLVAWRARLLARSASPSSLVDNLLAVQSGVAWSVGTLPLAVAAMALIALTLQRSEATRLPPHALLILGVSVLPIGENLLMAQHAGQFSFDRLKWLLPLTLGVVLTLPTFRRWLSLIPIGLLTVTAAFGYLQYAQTLSQETTAWAPYESANEQAQSWVERQLADDYECATFSTTSTVRGYLNMLFKRGIYENVPDMSSAEELTRQRGGCATVFILSSTPIVDMNSIDALVISRPNGTEQLWTPLAEATMGGAVGK